MMRVALAGSKDATTPEAQLSLQGNKRAQNEASRWNPTFPGVAPRVRIRNFKAYAIDGGAWPKAEIAKWWPTIKPPTSRWISRGRTPA
jgi:hypothetical protein